MENNKRLILNFLLYTTITIVVLLTLFFSYNIIIKKNDRYFHNNGDVITYKAIFVPNGAMITTKELTCTKEDNQCIITLPSFERENGISLGYNTSASDKIALYKIGDTVNLTNDTIFYAISYQELSLSISANVDYLSSAKTSCNAYNEDSFCYVSIPWYNKIGYETRGYSTSNESLTGFIYPSEEYKLTKNTTIYPIYNTLTRLDTISVDKVYNVDNMLIEVEKKCSYDIYKKYLDYFNIINSKAKYLVVGSKITILTDKTFDKIWGKSYVGMNYGPRNLRLIDIRCQDNDINNYYATIIHEMAHTWDFYYGTKKELDISEQNDIINLFNEYRSFENQPFREYSYTNIREFVADMVRYYYLKYIDPINYYSSLDYPSKIKKVLEKYICIASNNYDESKC